MGYAPRVSRLRDEIRGRGKEACFPTLLWRPEKQRLEGMSFYKGISEQRRDDFSRALGVSYLQVENETKGHPQRGS